MIGVPASRPVLVAVPPPPPPANTMQLPIERNPPPLKNPLLVVDVKFALAAELVIKARGAGLLAGVPWASDGEVVTLSERLPLFTVPEVLNCESRVPVMPSSGSLQTTPPAATGSVPKLLAMPFAITTTEFEHPPWKPVACAPSGPFRLAFRNAGDSPIEGTTTLI